MANIGVLIETDSNGVKASNFGVLSAARGDGNQVTAFVAADAEGCKEILGRHGVKTVVELRSEGEDLAARPELQAKVLAEACKEYGLEWLLGLCSSKGRDLLARVAALTDAPLVQDCLAINLNEKTAVKPFFSGKTTATLSLKGDFFLASIRPNVIDWNEAPVEAEAVTFSSSSRDEGRLAVKEVKKSGSGRVDLSEANIIITGGRPIGSAENFKLLEECADTVGGTVGASRVAVDLGYAPHSMQVGQTGKTVSPKLYIACGLSGSVQHFAGMKTSKVIVAINTDKDAPIFQKCDYGIIGDLFEVVPVLQEELARR